MYLLLQIDDQGLVNTDPRYVAVPNTWVNLIPTDVRGLTFSRTPQQVSSRCLLAAVPQSVISTNND